MHVAYFHYLTDEDSGQHHARQFVAGARSLGHRVDVYSMNLAPAGDGSIPGAGLVRSTLRRLARRSFGRYLHEPKELLWNFIYATKESRLLRAEKPEVLLVRDHPLNFSSLLVSHHLRIPLVLEMNAPAAEDTLYFDTYVHFPLISRKLQSVKLRRADAITVVSSSLKKYLIEQHQVFADKITVAPNGVDLTLFNPEVASETGLFPRGRGPVIGFVGSFRKWHGTDLFAQMILEIAALRSQTCFLMVGDGPEAESLRRVTTVLRDRVVFTGRVPQPRVASLVASLDIAVLPDSNFYFSPLKLFEWMAAGKAIVAPELPSLREILTDGVEGLLFKPRSLVALCAAVLRLIDDSRLRASLGTAAAHKARATLSWEDNARRVLEACEYAAARNPREVEGKRFAERR